MNARNRHYRHHLCVLLVSIAVVLFKCNPESVLAFQNEIQEVTSENAGPLLSPGDRYLKYLRILQLQGHVPVTPMVIQPSRQQSILPFSVDGRWGNAFRQRTQLTGAGKMKWSVLPVHLTAFSNSNYPQGQNNGGLWAGRGLSVKIDLGLYISRGIFSAQLAPSIYYSQNKSFETIPQERLDFSPYAYPWHSIGIDWPQRFGPDPISEIGWGQSYMALDFAGLSTRFGTQNLWWGPARINPILMSNNARGFPHVSFNTAEPIRLAGSDWEFSVIWGRLTESDWFDDNPDNDRRFLTGMIVDLQPAFFPGLTIGGARVFYRGIPTGGLKLNDYLVLFETFFKKNKASADNPGGDDDADQMLSIFWRWVFPESGFEMYGEWARNDHNWDLRDFMMEPDHSRAYTLGIQKSWNGKAAGYCLGLEVTQLGRSMTTLGRGSPPYYTHHRVRQGYTHDGMILGAGIGPGSESQSLALTRLSDRGAVEASFTRIRWDNDAYYSEIVSQRGFWGHDVSNILSIESIVLLDRFVLHPGIAYTWRMNRNFKTDGDAHNLRFSITVSAPIH